MKRLLLVFLAIMFLLTLAAGRTQETHITIWSLIAPDGSRWKAKTIVGGLPLQLDPPDGWTVRVIGTEIR